MFLKPNGAEALTLAETSALADVEILFPPSGDDQVSPCPDNALVVKFKNTEVLLVRKARGDLVRPSAALSTLRFYDIFCIGTELWRLANVLYPFSFE